MKIWICWFTISNFTNLKIAFERAQVFASAERLLNRLLAIFASAQPPKEISQILNLVVTGFFSRCHTRLVCLKNVLFTLKFHFSFLRKQFNSTIALSNIEFATIIWENFGEFAGILPNPLTDCKSGIKLSKLGIQIESVARSAGVMPLQFCLLGGLSIVHRAMSGDVSLLIPFNC